MNASDPVSVGDVLQELQATLEAAGIDNPAAEAQLIVGHVLDVPRGRVQALAVLDAALAQEDREAIRRIAAERADRVPLQHLTGRAPFRGLELSVGLGVFIPRPETEVVAQLAIDALMAVPTAQSIAIDLCTGSGAIALALAHEVTTARVWAIEKSIAAHAWAKRNVAELGDGRVELILGDVATAAESIPESVVGEAHVLVSNPPYVPSGMVPRDPEVREYDPAVALFAGEDGLDVIRIISRVGLRLLAPGGVVVLEHAEHQGSAVREVLASAGWRSPSTHRDLTLRDRATTAHR